MAVAPLAFTVVSVTHAVPGVVVPTLAPETGAAAAVMVLTAAKLPIAAPMIAFLFTLPPRDSWMVKRGT